MPHTLHIDIETYCDLDLTKVGVYAYVEHPSFRILMAGWSYDRGPVTVETEDIYSIPGLWDDKVEKVAHNAAFERVCFSEFLRRATGVLGPGEYLDPEHWHDTQAVAAELGYPQKLEWLAAWIGGEQKDSAGTRLINLFSKPNVVKRGEPPRRVLPEEKPAEWQQFKDYCGQDVVTLIEVDTALGPFPTETERQVYLTDQVINDRGVRVDVAMARAAEAAAAANAREAEAEIRRLTGVENANSLVQLKAWLQSAGCPLPDLRAETIEGALAGDRLLTPGALGKLRGDEATEPSKLSPTARRVLELRQDIALVAAKKYTAVRIGVNSDGRLRGQFRFFGAHTGRWAGRGVQLHNLPRDQFTKIVDGKKVWDETTETATILDLALGLGAEPTALKKIVRATLVGPMTVVDYSAIEARIIAWLAGETWALEAFAAGRDIYVETAERMSTPSKPLTRAQGKIAVLALGYNGAVGSLQAMGADGSEAELKELVVQWRAANTNIVDLWAEMGAAFQRGGRVGEHLQIDTDGKDRLLWLPSGRPIVYHDVRHRWVDGPYGRKLEASFLDPKGHGLRTRTYGGRLSENATQAVARDVLAEALVRLHTRGYKPIGHVHDEILVEGVHKRRRGRGYVSSVEAITDVMTELPAWAEGLPLDGAGFTTQRYRKD